MKYMLRLTFLLALGALLACTRSNIIVGGDDASTADGGMDAAIDATTTDTGPVLCGSVACGTGELCCGSCPGEGPRCIAGDACPELSCPPPRTCGTETCTDGSPACCEACDGSGSYCSGPGGICPGCPPPVVCGEETCGAGITQCCTACDGSGSFCAGGPGGECPPCPPPVVCGGVTCDSDITECCVDCDGNETCGFDGAASCPDLSCPPPSCDAQDVTWVGGCEPGLRYHWNGSRCIGGAGCDCRGDDCSSTFGSQEACEAAYSECRVMPAPCAEERALGVGDCDAEIGSRWNGFRCEAISGCECEGADCGRALGRSVEVCEAAHRFCPNCTGDFSCEEDEFCMPCATGSCEVCLDCIDRCMPSPCMGDGSDLICLAPRPDCGDGRISVVRSGCWACVDAETCE